VNAEDVFGLIVTTLTFFGLAVFLIRENELTPAGRRKKKERRLRLLEEQVSHAGRTATDNWIKRTDQQLEDIVLERIERRTGCSYVLLSPEAQKRLDAVVRHELDHVVQWTVRGARKAR